MLILLPSSTHPQKEKTMKISKILFIIIIIAVVIMAVYQTNTLTYKYIYAKQAGLHNFQDLEMVDWSCQKDSNGFTCKTVWTNGSDYKKCESTNLHPMICD